MATGKPDSLCMLRPNVKSKATLCSMVGIQGEVNLASYIASLVFKELTNGWLLQVATAAGMDNVEHLQYWAQIHQPFPACI